MKQQRRRIVEVADPVWSTHDLYLAAYLRLTHPIERIDWRGGGGQDSRGFLVAHFIFEATPELQATVQGYGISDQVSGAALTESIKMLKSIVMTRSTSG